MGDMRVFELQIERLSLAVDPPLPLSARLTLNQKNVHHYYAIANEPEINQNKSPAGQEEQAK